MRSRVLPRRSYSAACSAWRTASGSRALRRSAASIRRVRRASRSASPSGDEQRRHSSMPIAPDAGAFCLLNRRGESRHALDELTSQVVPSR